MYFKCKNCSGNTVYSPEKHMLYCPFCDSEKSGERTESKLQEMNICPNCGGEIPLDEYTSATKCPYCDSYMIFNQRVEGEYLPKVVIPFQLGKETVKSSVRDKFKKCIFAPSDFLSEARLNSMEGEYVPYWMYDFDTHCSFHGEGTKVRTWRSGNTEYTETSVFDVWRELDIPYEKIPADASIAMPDDVMDLIEPYNYAELVDFNPEYLSGFHAEMYNMPAAELAPRAKAKMETAANTSLKESYAGYASMKTITENVQVRREAKMYGLLPAWKYNYKYNGQDYPFYINGQTGKVVGAVPVSKSKVWAYSLTLWASMAAVACLGSLILSLL